MFITAANFKMSTLLHPIRSVPNTCLLLTSKTNPPFFVVMYGDVLNGKSNPQPRQWIAKVEQKP